MGNDFNRSGPKCPCCKDCPDREPACHDRCERYIEWKKKLAEYREAERRNSRDLMSDANKRRIWKKNRYQNQQPISRSGTER